MANAELLLRVGRIAGRVCLPHARGPRVALAMVVTCALVAVVGISVLRAQPGEPSKAGVNEEDAVMGVSGSESGVEALPEQLVELAGRKFAESLGEGIAYQAGLPTAYVQALNQAGTEIDFAGFTAMSGWAFSFGYQYDDIYPAFMAIRGQPGADGQLEAFQIAGWFGYEYESAPVEEKEKLWAFVQKHIDAGTPILSEHYDGGLICGYRERNGKREVWFAVDPPSGKPAWIDVNDLHPAEVCALAKKGEALPERELYFRALRRAVKRASPHEIDGVPQGLAALEAYAADVADAGKDFEKGGEWFCWGTFERLDARKCCGVWLRRAAEVLNEPGLGRAAERYERAYGLYAQYRAAVGAGQPTEESLQERARTPERIAKIVPMLRGAIDAEREGIREMEEALGRLGG
jgi:hypothetical protein